jgi:hypothetical protein
MAPSDKDSFLVEFPYRGDKRTMPPAIAAVLLQSRDNQTPQNMEVNRNVATSAWRATFGEQLHYSDIAVVTVGDTLGYPIPTVGIRNTVAEVKRRLMDKQVYCAGRWGSWGYFNLPHCFNDADAAYWAESDMIRYLYSTFYYAI